MLGVKWLLLCLYPSLCLAGIILEEVTPESASLLLSPSCPLSLLLIGRPSEQMRYAEDFLKSLIPSLMEELSLSYLRLPDPDRFPLLAAGLSLREIPVQFLLKRREIVRHFRGKLKHTEFIKFIRLNVEDYSVPLSDNNFDSMTGVYTWDREVDWLVQFHGARPYPLDLWSDVGYRLKGFALLGHVNLTSSPYTEARFSHLLENLTLPATLFFRNQTVYRYTGKVAASNFVAFLRDFFYNPKLYHKLMYKHGPPPYNVPAPPHLYRTPWDYLVIPEIYNVLLLLTVFAVITVVRNKLKGLQAIEDRQRKDK